MTFKFYDNWKDVDLDEWRWPNFAPQEIACHGDGSLLIDYESMDMLQALRELMGKPLVINSAYRSPIYNAFLPGASPKSQHTLGKAFDIRLWGFTRQELKRAARAVGFTGIGDYDTFVHVDTGPTRYWNNRSGK